MNMKVWLFYLMLLSPLVGLLARLIINRSELYQYIQILLNSILCIVTLSALTSHYSSTIDFGGWLAPFGISFKFYSLNLLVLFVFYTVALCVTLYSFQDTQLKRFSKGFYIGYWLLLFGITNLLATQDIFNFYVWSEVILVSCFVILNCHPKSNLLALSHYAVFNIIGTLLMLLGIAAIYQITGSLSYGSIAVFIQKHSDPHLYLSLFVFLFAILLKAGIFPLYFWLPRAYPATSYSSVSLLASLVTKAMLFTLLNFFIIWNLYSQKIFMDVMLILAMLTMVLGVLGAATQFNMKKILSFHIVSQVGYLLMAAVIPATFSFVAMIYFLIHNVIVKTGLFMVSGTVERKIGHVNLKKIGVLRKSYPALSIVFIIFALSLAGLPPFSGFWAKYLLIKAGITAHYYLSVTVAITVSLYTLYSMLKIWRLGFSQKNIDEIAIDEVKTIYMMEYLPLILLLIIMLVISFFPQLLIDLLLSAK